jgi:CBS domain-containing protein
MHPGILSCDAETTLAEIARIMSTHHVHCVAVGGTGEGRGLDSRVWAIVSDLDVLAAGLRPDSPDTAAELPKRPVVRVETTAPLRDAAELMLTKHTSHAVVVDPDTRHPVGILSTLDIARALARSGVSPGDR